MQHGTSIYCCGLASKSGLVVIVMIVLIILGLIFRVGWQKAVRGGITTGVGLAGLFLVVQCDRERFAASRGRNGYSLWG